MNFIIMLKTLGSLAKSQLTILSMLPYEDGRSQKRETSILGKRSKHWGSKVVKDS